MSHIRIGWSQLSPERIDMLRRRHEFKFCFKCGTELVPPVCSDGEGVRSSLLKVYSEAHSRDGVCVVCNIIWRAEWVLTPNDANDTTQNDLHLIAHTNCACRQVIYTANVHRGVSILCTPRYNLTEDCPCFASPR